MSDREDEQPNDSEGSSQPESEDKRGPPHARIAESHGEGMSIERYEEIRKAREAGEEVEYSEGEFEEYEELSKRMKQLAAKATRLVAPQFTRMPKLFSPKNLGFDGIMKSLGQQQFKVDFESVKPRNQIESFPHSSPYIPPTQDYNTWTESLNESLEAKREQDEEDRTLNRAQTEALQALAADSKQSRIDSKVQARLENRRHKGTMFWARLGFVVGAVAAAAAIGAVIVTVTISS